MKSGVELIKEERARQIQEDKFTAEDEACNANGELALAAICYAYDIIMMPTIETRRFIYHNWPYDWKYWKPTQDDEVKQLAKSGALIAAEINRLQNL